MRRKIYLLFLLLISTAFAQAQVKSVAQYIEQVQALANRADVKRRMTISIAITKASCANGSR